MTEQFILGEMLKKLIEEKAGYEVELTKGIGGGTSNIQPAMEKGEFDLYPEYTSSGWILVLGHKAGEVSDDKMLAKLQEEYEEKFDMTWVGLYGQNNTYAVVVREDTAKKLDGTRYWKVVASSDGRKQDTISPTGLTGAPRPSLFRVSRARSVLRWNL